MRKVKVVKEMLASNVKCFFVRSSQLEFKADWQKATKTLNIFFVLFWLLWGFNLHRYLPTSATEFTPIWIGTYLPNVRAIGDDLLLSHTCLLKYLYKNNMPSNIGEGTCITLDSNVPT